ncbi:MAG: hypothetical protein LW630_05310 [Saprospiraceae bacterium]|jgi:hypothetical protein|nr:hypothetical protein [Saprospiraceae bacterium]
MLTWYKEIILTECIILIVFWWSNPYIAFLLTVILCPVFIAVMLISKLADFFESSGVETEFYSLLAGLAIAPILLLLAVWLSGGNPLSEF